MGREEEISGRRAQKGWNSFTLVKRLLCPPVEAKQEAEEDETGVRAEVEAEIKDDLSAEGDWMECSLKVLFVTSVVSWRAVSDRVSGVFLREENLL